MAGVKDPVAPELINLERPLFGQFARQVSPLSAADISDCLREQATRGGRMGDILVKKGLLSQGQIAEVLRKQAQWIAVSVQSELAPTRLPYPAFLSVCVPAFNEEANIESLLDAACAILPEFLEEFEFVVVDDGSVDDTAEIVAAYSMRDPRVRLVPHESNRGYGAAVTTGMRAARGDLIMFTDSDGQFSLLDLPQLLVHVGDHDMVIGFRHNRADVGMRRLNAWSWNQPVKLILGVRVQDLDCAFKLFRRDVIDQLEMSSVGACINAEIMAQCIHAGLQIKELPVTHYPRYHGAPTGAALKVILKAFRELPQLRKYRTPSASLRSVIGSSPDYSSRKSVARHHVKTFEDA